MAEHAERGHRAKSGRNETSAPAQRSIGVLTPQHRVSARHDVHAALLNARADGPQPIQRKAPINRTGLPDRLKRGVEALSGMSLDDVRVHRNSPRPAQLNAFAYAQGSDIHLGPGQERHLPHEAWHVVQQAQGRVKPTRQLAAQTSINDDVALEHEADVMGALAAATPDERIMHRMAAVAGQAVRGGGQPAQLKIIMTDGTEFAGGAKAREVIAAIEAAGLAWRRELGGTLAGWLNREDRGPFRDFAHLLEALTAARADGVAIGVLGRAREESVAAASGGAVADTGRYGQDQVVHFAGSHRHVKLDIVGLNFYAIVGGAAKANNLEKFGTICRDLVAIAEQDRKEPRVYCAANTPASVVRLAQSIVGVRNVYQTETGDHWDIPLDINPYAIDMPDYGKGAVSDPATGLPSGAMPYIN